MEGTRFAKSILKIVLYDFVFIWDKFYFGFGGKHIHLSATLYLESVVTHIPILNTLPLPM